MRGTGHPQEKETSEALEVGSGPFRRAHGYPGYAPSEHPGHLPDLANEPISYLVEFEFQINNK